MADVLFDPKQIRPLFSGNVSRGILAQDAQISDTVRINANDEAELSDASTAAGVAGNIAMIVGVGNGQYRTDGQLKQGDKVTLLWQGRVATDRNDLDPGLNIFASDTPGKVGDAAGFVSRVLGAAINSHTLFFDGIVKA